MTRRACGAAAALCLLLCGCMERIPPLPDEPLVFTEGEFFPPEEESGYVTLEQEGKVYILYGIPKARLPLGGQTAVFGECLGTVEGNEQVHVFALAGEDSDVWLLVQDTVALMEPAVVFREIRSKGTVECPASVEPYGYEYWAEGTAEESGVTP
ncbi:MAG: hypothetical protein IJU18_02015 [Oscillospiraceae bacterium]|nr:hypothetical protein [Oscillospiraceae bacterium]